MIELASPQAQPPAVLSADCNDPVDLPDQAMSAGAVARSWAADRIALVDCGAKHSAVVRFYVLRDKALDGKARP